MSVFTYFKSCFRDCLRWRRDRLRCSEEEACLGFLHVCIHWNSLILRAHRGLIMARLLLFAFIFSVAVSPNVVESLRVILGELLVFPENCDMNESGSLEHIYSPQVSREVATYSDGVWTPGRDYRDRISVGSSVVFSRTVYNDNGKAYALTCRDLLGRSREKTVQLEVVVASEVTVTEGETAVLHCYYETTGKTGLSVLWKKNGTVLVKREFGSDGGSGTADGRLSVSPDGFSDGDLSLTVKEVQLDDGGDYFCYVGGKDAERSNPAVVRMTVSGRNQHQFTSTSPPAHVSMLGASTSQGDIWNNVKQLQCRCVL